jgi:hypothetical protein
MALPLRFQGVLIASVRGCDGADKNDRSKPVLRALRRTFLNPADEAECYLDGGFMSVEFTYEQRDAFLSDVDCYPVHFILHIMHACEVVGYNHPTEKVRWRFAELYTALVKKFHLVPELPEALDYRLTAKRIIDGRLTEPEGRWS